MTPAKLQQLHTDLKPFMIRRVKKDVEKSLPPKVEQLLRIEMTRSQKEFYKWILTRNYKELSKGGSASSLLNIVMELKKCCNHVMLVSQNPGEQSSQLQQLIRGSGKLILLDKLLTRLKEGGHRVLIFSQMVMMLDIIAEYLQLKRYPHQRLDGGIRGEQRRQAMDHFNAADSEDFCFLLSTRAGGLGINLATADTVIIFDSDWNPQNDLQAQARAHRIGQKKTVNIYRFVTKNSVEEEIIERAKQKMVLDHLVIQRMDATGKFGKGSGNKMTTGVGLDKDELDAVMRFGAEDLFKETDEEGADKKLEEMSLDDILLKAETRDSTAQSAGAGDELLAQFKTVNITTTEEDMEEPVTPSRKISSQLSRTPKADAAAAAASDGKSWDQIIPRHLVEKMEEEEAQKKALEMFLPPRKRTQPAAAAAEGAANAKASKGAKAASKPVAVQKPQLKDPDFSAGELRRFVRSYKKFADLARLDRIAADAGLLNFEMDKLKRLFRGVESLALTASHEDSTNDTPEGSQTKPGYFAFGPDSYFGADYVNRKREMMELGKVIKATGGAAFRITERVKDPKWGVEWTSIHDSKLLEGAYKHGCGNWELVRDDAELGLGDAILKKESAIKPQKQHLDTRVEYLLKLCFPTDKPDTKPVKASKSKKDSATETQSSSTAEQTQQSDEIIVPPPKTKV